MVWAPVGRVTQGAGCWLVLSGGCSCDSAPWGQLAGRCVRSGTSTEPQTHVSQRSSRSWGFPDGRRLPVSFLGHVHPKARAAGEWPCHAPWAGHTSPIARSCTLGKARVGFHQGPRELRAGVCSLLRVRQGVCEGGVQGEGTGPGVGQGAGRGAGLLTCNACPSPSLWPPLSPAVPGPAEAAQALPWPGRLWAQCGPAPCGQ